MDWLNAWHSICLCKFNSYVCVNFCKPSMAEPGQADALRRQNAPLSLSLHYREGQRPALPSSGGCMWSVASQPSDQWWHPRPQKVVGTSVVTSESLPSPTQTECDHNSGQGPGIVSIVRCHITRHDTWPCQYTTLVQMSHTHSMGRNDQSNKVATFYQYWSNLQLN